MHFTEQMVFYFEGIVPALHECMCMQCHKFANRQYTMKDSLFLIEHC